jgi:hypothetical protein
LLQCCALMEMARLRQGKGKTRVRQMCFLHTALCESRSRRTCHFEAEMKKERGHSPRELMEMTIEVMQQSVPEPRTDRKASPKVGAVLVKPDGTVQTACRGELRHGDHAEFTLLERKNRGNKLDGSILFATLEPCAPGARRDPTQAFCKSGSSSPYRYRTIDQV